MKIINLDVHNHTMVTQVAEMLVAGFAEHWPDAWPELDDALEEIEAMAQPERISRVAVDADGTALGWIGGIPEYDGNVWELHPLVVRPDMQGKGIGRALAQDLEAQVAARGGLTLQLGTDDEDGMTSLANVDLYPNVAEKIMNIRNLRRHPYEFYQKLGFVITGVVPDANGWGKPDIMMSKRVSR